MATINSKIDGVDVLGSVTAGETIYVGRATSTQHGIVKPAATDFEFDAQTNAMLIKLGVGLKRTDDGIAIAIYDGNVVTDVLAVEDGLEIKYTDIDEETENSKIIPWSEFTAAETEYLKKYFNIEPGTGEGAVQQIGAKATGPHSAAFGSKRYDKPNGDYPITEAKGGNAFAAGGSVAADGDFTAAFGKGTKAEQSASFAAGTNTQAGKTLEEYVAAGGSADDYAKSYAAAAVFGDGNKAKGYADFAAGNANESDGTSNTTVGGANKVKGTRNFTGGEANEVGQSGSSDVGNALTFGQHLKNTGRWNRVTFGQFNADDLAALFEIGNGTSDTNRVNIFVIKDNGAVYTGKLGKIHQGTRFQVSDGNSESDRRALIDSRHNGVTHIESYMSTLNGSVGNDNQVAASESGELKDIADPTGGNYPRLNTFLAGQGLQNKGRFNQVVFGQFNEFDALALFQVGTGNSDADRKKGFRVDYAGRAKSDTPAAGDEFYVRVADLGENVVFPYGEHSVDYDATENGLTVTGTMRIYVKKTASDDTSVYHDIPNVSMSVPIKAGNNINIDKADDAKWIVVSADGEGVDIGVGLPASATNGTLTAEQLALLQSSENNYIMFQHEKYYLEDKGHVEGYITYTHTGYENSTYWIKSITITVSTRAWVLNKGGLAGKGLNFDADGKLQVKTGTNLSFSADGTLNASGGGTIDANTLNGLLLSGNGITISYEIASDKVQINVDPRFIVFDNQSIDVNPNGYATEVYITDDPSVGYYEFTSDHAGEIRYTHNSNNDTMVLQSGTKGNVKTLFGNQSIYGSGNIDLYRHNLVITATASNISAIKVLIMFPSSSNTKVETLTDLYTACSSFGEIQASGFVTHNGEVCPVYSALCNSGDGIHYIRIAENDPTGVEWTALTGLTIVDTVTTV